MPHFETRSEAFDYMMTSLVEDGVPVEEAATRANTFAECVAKNKNLPNAPERPKNAIEKGVVIIQQIASVKREYPEVWDLVTGAVGGLIGGFAGASAATTEEPRRESIDFDNLK